MKGRLIDSTGGLLLFGLFLDKLCSSDMGQIHNDSYQRRARGDNLAMAEVLEEHVNFPIILLSDLAQEDEDVDGDQCLTINYEFELLSCLRSKDEELMRQVFAILGGVGQGLNPTR